MFWEKPRTALLCLPQSAVYLAGGRSTFRHAHGLPATSEAAAAAEKRLHAPARRLARTVISLGRGEGQLFAMRALKAVQAVSGAAEGDLHRCGNKREYLCGWVCALGLG